MVAPFFVHAVQLPQLSPSWLPHSKGSHFSRDNQIFLVKKPLKKNFFSLGFINIIYLAIWVFFCTFDVGLPGYSSGPHPRLQDPANLKFQILLTFIN